MLVVLLVVRIFLVLLFELSNMIFKKIRQHILGGNKEYRLILKWHKETHRLYQSVFQQEFYLIYLH